MISESKTLLISDYCVLYAHAVLIFIVIVMKTEQDVNSKQCKYIKNSIKMKYLYQKDSYNLSKIKQERDANGGKA